VEPPCVAHLRPRPVRRRLVTVRRAAAPQALPSCPSCAHAPHTAPSAAAPSARAAPRSSPQASPCWPTGLRQVTGCSRLQPALEPAITSPIIASSPDGSDPTIVPTSLAMAAPVGGCRCRTSSSATSTLSRCTLTSSSRVRARRPHKGECPCWLVSPTRTPTGPLLGGILSAIQFVDAGQPSGRLSAARRWRSI
jgi:hypothetical protein